MKRRRWIEHTSLAVVRRKERSDSGRCGIVVITTLGGYLGFVRVVICAVFELNHASFIYLIHMSGFSLLPERVWM
jgi:hypothetical protein